MNDVSSFWVWHNQNADVHWPSYACQFILNRHQMINFFDHVWCQLILKLTSINTQATSYIDAWLISSGVRCQIMVIWQHNRFSDDTLKTLCGHFASFLEIGQLDRNRFGSIPRDRNFTIDESYINYPYFATKWGKVSLLRDLSPARDVLGTGGYCNPRQNLRRSLANLHWVLWKHYQSMKIHYSIIYMLVACKVHVWSR